MRRCTNTETVDQKTPLGLLFQIKALSYNQIPNKHFFCKY